VTFLHIGYRSLAFNFTCKLVPAYQVCSLGVSAACSLKSSNREGEKGCRSWINAELFCNYGFCTWVSRSSCITSRVYWLTTSAVRGPPQFQFPALPVIQSRANCKIQTATMAKMDMEYQNFSDSGLSLNHLLRCHIHFIKTSACSAFVLIGPKKLSLAGVQSSDNNKIGH